MSSHLISPVVVISFISHHVVYYVTMVTGLFSQKEMDYLNSQRLARIATASASTLSEEAGSVQPDVVPVGYDFDGDCFYVGVDPWDPRGMKIYGTAVKVDIWIGQVTLILNI